MSIYKVEAQLLLTIEVEAENEKEARVKMFEHIIDQSNIIDALDWRVYAYKQ